MGTLAPLPGRLARPWCPSCNAPAGPDCPGRAPTRRQVRRRLGRETVRLAHDAMMESGKDGQRDH